MAHLKEHLRLRARLTHRLADNNSTIVAMVIAALVALFGGRDLRKHKAQSQSESKGERNAFHGDFSCLLCAPLALPGL